MSFEAKIVAFWVLVGLILAVLRVWGLRSPDSRGVRALLSPHGPVWQVGERKSTFYRRKTGFALGWLLQVAVVDAVLLGIVQNRLLPAEYATSTAVAGFALVIGTGMASLGTILAALVSLKARLLGPDPVLPAPVEASVDDDEDVPGR